MLTNHPSRLAGALKGQGILIVQFKDGDRFRLRDCYEIDRSVYGESGKWSASVVEAIQGKHQDFRRLYRSGSGLDFVESDVMEVTSEIDGRLLYHRNEVA